MSAVSLALLGCSLSMVRFAYIPDNNPDPPPITIMPARQEPLISPTIVIISPTPSGTVTPSFTPLPTASSAPSPTVSWTATFTLTPPSLTQVWAGLPSLTRSPTPYRLATWTPPAPPTWTTAPVIPYRTATQAWTPHPTSSWTPLSSATSSPDQSANLDPSTTQSPGEISASETPSGSSPDTPIPTSTPTNTPVSSQTLTPSRTATATRTRAGCNVIYNDAYETQVIQLINSERVKASLPALTVSGALMSSRGHSVDMAVNNYFSHTGSDGSTAWSRMVSAGYIGRWGGENIYAGYSSGLPTEAVNWWMNSAPHKANILGVNYKNIGVGYVYCDTSTYRNYYTVNFGAP